MSETRDVEGLTLERVEGMLCDVQGHLGMTIADIDIAAERGEAWPVDPDALVEALSAGYDATEKLGATIRTLRAERDDYKVANEDAVRVANNTIAELEDAKAQIAFLSRSLQARSEDVERKDAALRQIAEGRAGSAPEVARRALAPVADQMGEDIEGVSADEAVLHYMDRAAELEALIVAFCGDVESFRALVAPVADQTGEREEFLRGLNEDFARDRATTKDQTGGESDV